MAKRGPKTLASQGKRPKVQISISIPADLHDLIIELAKKENSNKSSVITKLLKKSILLIKG